MSIITYSLSRGLGRVRHHRRPAAVSSAIAQPAMTMTMTPPSVGTKAPDFSLRSAADGAMVRLADAVARGPVVLVVCAAGRGTSALSHATVGSSWARDGATPGARAS